MNAWQGVLVYAATMVVGILVNLGVAAYYAGKYKERVERLTGEVDRYTDRVGKLERKFAAFTGKANGESFQED